MSRLPLALVPLAAGLAGCEDLRALVVRNYPTDYAAEQGAEPAREVDESAAVSGTFDGPDAALPRLEVRLLPVIGGLAQPTDVQFPPGRSDVAVVLQKGGEARMFSMPGGEELGTLLDLDPLTKSEQGLLGLAFHPRFADNGRIFVNWTTEDAAGAEVSRVTAYTVDTRATPWTAGSPRTIMEVEQPYANHNAGQLAFGPDGYLYVGWGDGGWRDDPHDNGQDLSTLLGAMLRVDVDREEAGRAYGIPADNPFVGRAGARPEVWAYGLRNPWRYSFDPRGRLVVADVGQNTYEEVSVVEAGENLGWKVREGRHCFPPGTACPDPAAGGLQDPVWEYDHQVGQSITGGYVYTGSAIPALQGRYLVGDFVAGRLWALDLPEDAPPSPPEARATALGRFRILPSTFGRDAAGEVYVADFQAGVVYKLLPPQER